MRKFLFTFLILGIATTNLAQDGIQLDIGLSSSTDKYKVLAHRDSTSHPDTVHIVGNIVKASPGIGGDLCSGGTLKIKLTERIHNYPHEFIYLVMTPVTRVILDKEVHLTATQYTGKEEECYYKQIINIVDSEGIPFFKLSKEETNKLKAK